jgi:hypothetical protein
MIYTYGSEMVALISTLSSGVFVLINHVGLRKGCACDLYQGGI